MLLVRVICYEINYIYKNVLNDFKISKSKTNLTYF